MAALWWASLIVVGDPLRTAKDVLAPLVDEPTGPRLTIARDDRRSHGKSAGLQPTV